MMVQSEDTNAWRSSKSDGATKPRTPLTADYVSKTNAAAMKALGDVEARRKWGESRHGSPITTNLLCAEIARLNIVQETLTKALQRALELCEGFDDADMAEEGVEQIVRPVIDACRAALAKAGGAA